MLHGKPAWAQTLPPQLWCGWSVCPQFLLLWPSSTASSSVHRCPLYLPMFCVLRNLSGSRWQQGVFGTRDGNRSSDRGLQDPTSQSKPLCCSLEPWNVRDSLPSSLSVIPLPFPFPLYYFQNIVIFLEFGLMSKTLNFPTSGLPQEGVRGGVCTDLNCIWFQTPSWNNTMGLLKEWSPTISTKTAR